MHRGRVLGSPQVLCFQLLAPVAFRLCHFATGSYSPITTRLTTSWQCWGCVCVGVRVCQRSKRKALSRVGLRSRRWGSHVGGEPAQGRALSPPTRPGRGQDSRPDGRRNSFTRLHLQTDSHFPKWHSRRARVPRIRDLEWQHHRPSEPLDLELRRAAYER